ncbi:hypothetical protein [Salipiger mucosus]|uniref:Lysozyme inhibitor LprI N-terminal domain-containing protein n=1 Tax=Salipiger mucosus DSM 16094 TaxID=1123237 RepID=S9QL86_9RHOB|nr:hypothetical protein [Salipiger mucosus]EPX82211.1 hypothetical protein Salmuc_05468 [Salipiger mucosus DSM 16094]
MRYLLPLALLLCLAAFPRSGSAARDDRAGIATEYAVCTGRFAAMAQHDRMRRDPRHDAAEMRRDWMRALLDATRSDLIARADDDGALARRFLLARSRAARAQARLLNTASYDEDPRRARMARATAMRHLRACHGLLTR